MQGLRDARFLLAFAGARLATLGSAEGVEELRDQLRVGKLQRAGAERVVCGPRVAAGWAKRQFRERRRHLRDVAVRVEHDLRGEAADDVARIVTVVRVVACERRR